MTTLVLHSVCLFKIFQRTRLLFKILNSFSELQPFRSRLRMQRYKLLRILQEIEQTFFDKN